MEGKREKTIEGVWKGKCQRQTSIVLITKTNHSSTVVSGHF